MRKRDVYYWQERSILNNLNEEWKEHLVFKIIDNQKIEGIGAATPNKEFGETFKTSMAVVESLRKITENFENMNNIIEFEKIINSQIKKDMAAKAAVFLSIYDYISNKKNIKLENYYFDLNEDHKKEYFERIFIDKNHKISDSKNENIKLDIKNYIKPDDLLKIIKHYSDKNLIIDFSSLYNSLELKYIINKTKNFKIVALEQPFEIGQEFQAKKYINEGYKIYWDESFHNFIDFDRIHEYSTGFVFSISKMSSLYNISNLLNYTKSKGYEAIITSEIEHPINLMWSKKISKAFDVIDLDFLKNVKETNK